MNARSNFKWTTLVTLMVLVANAVWTVPALADDETPPPVDTPTQATTPAEVQPAESAPLVPQLPAGTELVVTDENGESVPLATQAAAQAIASIDPVWCPTGVAPQNGTGGCTASYADLYSLVNDIATNVIPEPTNNGVIWIAGGPDASVSPIVIDGADVDLGTWKNFSLTLKGGWNNTFGSTVTNPLTPSVLAQTLSIIGWNGALTLSDIVVSGATSSTAADDNALVVDTTKNILLDRVVVEDASNSDGSYVMSGALLINSLGTGTVTVNNSSFRRNEGDGVNIISAGVITTTNLVASGNFGFGANIDNSFALTAKSVTLKGQKQFNNNGVDGLNIYSNGLITLSNLVAYGNGGKGVYLDNRTSTTNQGITISGTNQFTNNVDAGIVILSHGAITGNNFYASDNGGYGAFLDNCDLDLSSDCQVPLAKTVKLTGTNTFNNNGSTGLVVESFGAISLNNLMASYNSGTIAIVDDEPGAYIDNQWSSSATSLDSVGTWTITGYATFNNNFDEGLQGYSHGSMVLNNVTARNNGLDGANLDVDKIGIPASSITLKGVNNFLYNGKDGIFANADGKITLASVTASLNIEDGVDLQNSALNMGIILSGTNTFLMNGTYGFSAYSGGTISLSNVTSSYNEFGAFMENDIDPTKPIYNINLTGTNSFNDNDGYGMLVISNGSIAINNLTANDNGFVDTLGGGVFLDNCVISGPSCTTITAKPITLTGSVNVIGNYEDGLIVDSLGAITLNNVYADGNGGFGVALSNDHDTAKTNGVTIKGSNTFNSNLVTGLSVTSFGAIMLNNITANWNGNSVDGGAGAYLDNCDFNISACTAVTAKNITLTGVNSFIGNYMDGLFFDSHGTVLLTRVNADGNDWDGVSDGYDGAGIRGTADNSITLICGHTVNNGTSFSPTSPGYDLQSFFSHAVIIKGIYSDSNQGTDIASGTPVTVPTYPCALP